VNLFRFWTTFFSVLAIGVLGYAVWSYWDTPLPLDDRGITQGLNGTLGIPIHLGPALLASYLVLGGIALALKKGASWTAFKLALGFGLLGYVVWANWSFPSEVEALSALRASTATLGTSPPAAGPVALAPALQNIKEDLGLVGAFSKPWNLQALYLAGAIYLAGILLTFVRWYVLVRAQELPFTLVNAFRLGLIGFALSTFLPGSVGGDIIKAAQIAREQDRRTVAVATVLVDRFMGLCALIWLVALLGGVFWLSGYLQETASTEAGITAMQTIVLGSWALLLGTLAFWFVLGFFPPHRARRLADFLERIPKIGKSVAELWRAVWMYRRQGRSILLALLLSLVGHVGFVLTFYFSALTLSPADKIPSILAHFLVVPVGMIIQGGFPSPGGVGGGEYGYGSLYKLLGFAFAAGVLGSLIQRFITWILGFAGYIIYLRMRPYLRPSTPEPPQEAPDLLAVAPATSRASEAIRADRTPRDIMRQ
jgi:uncharacterized protein (TIRG00374 family)